jgi:hypothetical protein
MNKPKAFFVISRYNEDFSWVDEYTDNYLIYNKGDPILDNPKIVNTENWGYNLRDIPKYIFENYNNLPNLIAFMQADPFPHCFKKDFNDWIYNECFTPLETKGYHNGENSEPVYYMEPNQDGRFTSLNFSQLERPGKFYPNLDAFMGAFFLNYTHLDIFRFSPGAQYIIEKKQALKYPKKLWEGIMHTMDARFPIQSHMFERLVYTILNNDYRAKDEFYE